MIKSSFWDICLSILVFKVNQNATFFFSVKELIVGYNNKYDGQIRLVENLKYSKNMMIIERAQ